MPARVLAIESDVRQGTILKRIVKDKVHADLVLVDSRDAAIASINASIPDVILVTALLSPRDEEELIAHLRTLDGADHLQLHTIPQLASGREDGDGGGAGLFGKLKKKKDAPIPGCDPDLFAEEIRSFLDAAEQAKAMAASNVHRRKRFDPSAPSADTSASSGFADFAADSHTAGEAHGASAPGGGAGLDEGVIGGSAGDSAWASPFEWRPSTGPAKPAGPAQPPPLVTNKPLAVVADEALEARERQEQERQREAAARAEQEKQRKEAEARAAEEERQRKEAAARAAEEERKHKEAAARAEEEARRKREEEERKRKEAAARAEEEARRKREEEERKRKDAAARAAEEERKRKEAEARAAEAERKRKEAEARAAEEERKRKEAAARAEEEARKRREAEARAAEEERKRREAAARAEEERKRKEAEARAAEAERKRKEAEARAAEEERRRKEAEARAAEEERKRLEALARAEEERKRREAIARAEEEARRKREDEERKRREEEERQRREAERLRLEIEAAAAAQRAAEERQRQEAAREAERQRLEAEAAAARQRAEAAARKRDEQDRISKKSGKTLKPTPFGGQSTTTATAPRIVPSEFAEFSEEHEKLQAGILGLDCLDAWARRDRRAASVETERVESDELSELFAALTIPAPVASVGYPGGCRIRRVRVPPDPSAKPAGKKGQPVILSRRALDEMRSANR